MTTDTPTTVELAMEMRNAEWFPSTGGIRSENAWQREGAVVDNLERIAWAAAVWLMSEGCEAGIYCVDVNQTLCWYGIGKGVDVEDPDPIRATLLAAREASKCSH